jgi:hypothetical protein
MNARVYNLREKLLNELRIASAHRSFCKSKVEEHQFDSSTTYFEWQHRLARAIGKCDGLLFALQAIDGGE